MMDRLLWQTSKYLFLLTIGGSIYYLIEILYSGSSHPSMFLLGGWCFVVCGLINKRSVKTTPIYIKMLYCALAITYFEFIAGVGLNLYMGLGVWDYHELPLNFFGQICLPFSLVWYFLSMGAIVIDDYIRYWFYGEEKPNYKGLTGSF